MCFNLDKSWGTVSTSFHDKSNSSKEVSWVMTGHTSVRPQSFSLSIFRCFSLDRSWGIVSTLLHDKSNSSKEVRRILSGHTDLVSVSWGSANFFEFELLGKSCVCISRQVQNLNLSQLWHGLWNTCQPSPAEVQLQPPIRASWEELPPMTPSACEDRQLLLYILQLILNQLL